MTRRRAAPTEGECHEMELTAPKRDSPPPPFKALPRRGARPPGGILVAIVVEDRGGGIDANALKSIGEPFMSSKGRRRGLGVLKVKKMIAGADRGTVGIESDCGQGTRVKLVTPRPQTFDGGRKRKGRRRTRG
jgi:signal transduction histidine kinase